MKNRRIALISALVVASVPLLATAASAHIAISSPDAVQGAEMSLLSFRVPDESPNASTVKVSIDLPIDNPVANVWARAIPGWTATTTMKKLAAPVKIGDFNVDTVPATVTWTAQSGTGIGPGEFQIFEIVADPLPKVPVMTFAAHQTYSDGSVVDWNQPPAADGSEAEHPSPEIELAAADSGAGMNASTSPSADASLSPVISASATPLPTASASSDTSGDSLARWLAGLAVVLSGACLAILVSRRRS
jgi:uncharacterized protein YcnI